MNPKELKTICSQEYVLEKERMLRSKAYTVAFENLKRLCPQYPLAYNSEDSYDISQVKRLMGQYYYGIEAQKELLYKCIELKWIKI